MSQLIARTSCIAGLGLVLSWLVLTGSSPLSSWVVNQPSITNVASAVNLPTVLFAVSGASRGHMPPDSAVAALAVLQWLLYGFIIAAAWRKLRPSNSFKPKSFRGSA